MGCKSSRHSTEGIFQESLRASENQANGHDNGNNANNNRNQHHHQQQAAVRRRRGGEMIDGSSASSGINLDFLSSERLTRLMGQSVNSRRENSSRFVPRLFFENRNSRANLARQLRDTRDRYNDIEDFFGMQNNADLEEFLGMPSHTDYHNHDRGDIDNDNDTNNQANGQEDSTGVTSTRTTTTSTDTNFHPSTLIFYTGNNNNYNHRPSRLLNNNDNNNNNNNNNNVHDEQNNLYIEQLQLNLRTMQQNFQSILQLARSSTNYIGDQDNYHDIFFHQNYGDMNSYCPPASPNTIKALAKVQISKLDLIEQSNCECCICVQPYLLDDAVTRLPCGHLFHPQCISPWLHKHCTCPICRWELQTQDETFEPGRISRMDQRKIRIRRHDLERLNKQDLKELLRIRNIGSSIQSQHDKHKPASTIYKQKDNNTDNRNYLLTQLENCSMVEVLENESTKEQG